MSHIAQIHNLYNAAGVFNCGRDKNPKTLPVFDAIRQRWSAQSQKKTCQKRFRKAIRETMGRADSINTRAIGIDTYNKGIQAGLQHKDALELGQMVADVFSKSRKNKEKNLVSESKKEPEKKGKKSKKPTPEQEAKALKTNESVKIHPEEIIAIEGLIKKRAAGDKITTDDLYILQKGSGISINLFGRPAMSNPKFRVDACVCFNHAFSVNRTVFTDDFFTCLDDISLESDASDQPNGSVSSHLNTRRLSASVYYQYISIDYDLLRHNLNDDKKLITGYLSALADVIPWCVPNNNSANNTGGQTSAFYTLAEKGRSQRQTYGIAFSNPIKPPNIEENAIKALKNCQMNWKQIHGNSFQTYEVNFFTKQGNYKDLTKFIADYCHD